MSAAQPKAKTVVINERVVRQAIGRLAHAIREWDGDKATAQFYVRNVRAILIHHTLLPRNPVAKKGVNA